MEVVGFINQFYVVCLFFLFKLSFLCTVKLAVIASNGFKRMCVKMILEENSEYEAVTSPVVLAGRKVSAVLFKESGRQNTQGKIIQVSKSSSLSCVFSSVSDIITVLEFL